MVADQFFFFLLTPVSMVRHPKIVECYGACTKGSQPFIVMEYFARGSLRRFIEISRIIPDYQMHSPVPFTPSLQANAPPAPKLKSPTIGPGVRDRGLQLGKGLDPDVITR